MVVVKTVDNRWIRRYRIFFFVGIIIFIFQLFLAIRFFTIQSDNDNLPSSWNDDAEVSVNSARRSNNALIIDDEEALVNKVPKSPTVTSLTTKQVAKLRLEELDFKPTCEISAKEAVSAIHRAKTQRCKQEIANITCLIQKGLLYPKQLPNYCPNDGQDAGKLLGCFKDEKSFRLLSGYYGKNKNANSPEYCVRLCLQSGFAYAGVQYSIECFCGNDEPLSTAKLPDSSCNMKCPSDPQNTCGGYFTMNIFQTGIKKFSPHIASTGTTNIKQVRIVFLLTLNGRALRQVKRLIKILYQKDHYFYIHVDARQDYLFRELLMLERQFPNIRLTRRRFATIWGGASLLKMLRSAMSELIEDFDWDWDFIINLSESDYPVKTINRLVSFLSVNKDKNFVKSHGREVQRFIQKQGLDKTFIECDTHMWRTGDRKIPWGIQIDGGSDWVALSRNFVEYIATDTPDELVQGLLVLFKYTLLPAESFFHTVLRNSNFCNTYIDNNLHVTNWKRKLGCKCQYKHIVDWCGCSPNDFKPEDWLRIQNTESRQIYFARKFEPIVNQVVILQLEQWLYGDIYHRNLLNIHSYWQSIYNSFDLGPSADDSLITLSDSAVRLTNKGLHNNCEIREFKIKEITSFHKNDSYQKTLVLYNANVTNVGTVRLETWFKPKNTLLLIKSSNFVYRIKSMIVSSDYDQKEQISRNFARCLGPYSEPVLIYTFNAAHAASKSTNITLLWISPNGHLVDVTEISVDDMYVTGFSKPSLKQPLLPGAWTIKLIHHDESAAEVKFLVTPLSFVAGNTIVQNQVNFIHSGAETFKDFDSMYDIYLPSNFERERLELLSIANSKRFGPDLQEWIDTMFIKYYSLGVSCLSVNYSNANVCGVTISCTETDWSSLAPDPKSFIGKVNETTGGIN